MGGIKIEDQPVLIGRNRQQAEDLRFDRLLQIDDQAHHVGLELAHAHVFDEGIVRLHFARQIAQLVVELQALNVHHESRRIAQDLMGCAQGAVRLQRQPGVFGRRPDADGHQGGAPRNHGGRQQQHEAGRLHEKTPTRWGHHVQAPAQKPGEQQPTHGINRTSNPPARRETNAVPVQSRLATCTGAALPAVRGARSSRQRATNPARAAATRPD